MNMNMNKKKLPKAVTRTADEMRAAAKLEFITTTAETNSLTMHRKQPETEDGRVPTPKAIEIDAAQRQSRATAIVERYANFSVLGGAIPLPLINVAGVTVLILRMVKLLCDLYGVPYERGRARALIVGLAGGAAPTTASAVTTSTLIYFVPGANLVGLAVSSVTASVCTRAIGRRFVEHFETGATLLDFSVIDRR